MLDGEALVGRCPYTVQSGDTLARLGVRRVPACPVFSLAPSLCSTNSGPGRPRPFAGFSATMKGSELLVPVHHRLQLITFPMRASVLILAGDEISLYR